jgi:hypothetical protein
MTSQSAPPKKNFWLWEPLQEEPSVREIWFWWEKRRVAYNAFVIILAVLSSAIYVCSRMTPGLVPPQSTTEDIVPAMSLISLVIFGPIAWNILYSFGPLLEISVFKAKGIHDSHLGPTLIKLGVGFSAFIVLLPALLGVIDGVTFSVTGKKLTN